MPRIKCLITAIFASLNAMSGSAAASVDAGERWDCSGRLKFMLLGDFEIASVPYWTLRSNLVMIGPSTGFAFSDKQSADYASVLFSGTTLISEQLADDQISALIKEFVDATGRQKKRGIHSPRLPFEILPVRHIADNFYAWSAATEVRLLFRLQSRLYLMRINETPQVAENADYALRLSKNIKGRPPSSVPAANAICFPYSSVTANDGPKYWNVSSLYKLKAHPDVTIMVSDATLPREERAAKSREKSEKFLINDFWGQNTLAEDVEKIERGYSLGNGRTVRLAKQKGVASYVKILRKNGVVDFGYYALSRGSPTEPASTDIAISLMTNAKFAKAKGVRPVTEDEFLRMVERLQNSVTVIE